jgi:hypothetical protein
MGLVELLLPSTAPAKVARRSAYFTARAPALDHLPALEYFQPGRTLRLSLFSTFPAARWAAHTHMQQQHARTCDAPNPPPRAFMAALRTVKTEYEKSICASGCENPVCEIDAWTHAEHYKLPFGRSVWYPVEYGGEANEVISYMPGIVCQNVDGLSSSLRACLLSILKIHASNPIFAACLQEHHLTKAKIAGLDAEAEAFRLGVLLIINPMPDGDFKGGTAIAIPFDAIELKEGETRDPALSPDGRLTTVDILLNAKPHRVANAYAPQDDTVRPQFLQDLTDEINDHTILALDANCVPDTTPTTSAPSTASQ